MIQTRPMEDDNRETSSYHIVLIVAKRRLESWTPLESSREIMDEFSIETTKEYISGRFLFVKNWERFENSVIISFYVDDEKCFPNFWNLIVHIS